MEGELEKEVGLEEAGKKESKKNNNEGKRGVEGREERNGTEGESGARNEWEGDIRTPRRSGDSPGARAP